MARKTSLADALPDRPPGETAADPTTLSETGSRARRVLPVDLASIEIPPRLRPARLYRRQSGRGRPGRAGIHGL